MTETNSTVNSVNGIYWGAIILILGFLTFGLLGLLYAALYLLCFLAGVVAILYDHSQGNVKQSVKAFAFARTPEALSLSQGIPKVLETDYSKRDFNIDRRLTSSSSIDERLHECLDYLLRDYIKYWYNGLSDDPEFLHSFLVTLHDVIRALSSRFSSIDWQPYLTKNLVEDFASHVKCFRKAQVEIQESQEDMLSWKQRVDAMQTSQQSTDSVESLSASQTNNNNKSDGSDNGSDKAVETILDCFFDFEIKFSKTCRELVSFGVKKQSEYLQDVSEVLLYLLLPVDEFHCRPLKYMMRELLVHGVFLPMFKLYSDPDYLNQYVNWLISDNCITSEWFLNVLRHSSEIGELHSIREKCDEEIARLRAKDTVGDDPAIKQQLGSMRYVKNLCERQIRKKHDGNVYTDNIELDLEGYQTEKSKLYNLPLSVILRNNIALQIFIEYMQSVNGQAYLFFWLTVDGYRASAEQQLNEVKLQQLQGAIQRTPDMEMLRAIGHNIYDQYLSKHAEPRVPLDQTTDRALKKKLDSGEPSPYVFDDIQQKVFGIMQKSESFFPAFKASPYYMRLLAELDLLRETSLTSNDTNGSVGSSLDDISTSENEEVNKLTAVITQTGICKEHGKTYAMFAVTVTRHWGNGRQESWDTFRRYREFYDLHLSLKENGSNLSTIRFPGRTFFKDLKEDFLERRRTELNQYLSSVLSLEHCGKAMECLHTFLDAKAYQKNPRTFASKMDSMMRESAQSVANFMSQAPDNLIGGIQRASDKVSGGIQKFSDKLPGSERKLSNEENHIEYNIENNIPLRILLLLMDEVFDLKQRNQWLRRQMVAALQQVITTVFGDRMNRKIVDYVDNAVSAQQVSEYIRTFQDSFWPGGILADVTPVRDDITVMRTRVLTKTKLHGVIPDEVRPLVGNETSRRGMARLFELLQHQELNTRFCYVLLEGVLCRVFPENRFQDLFTKFHSSSPKMRSHKRALMTRGVDKWKQETRERKSRVLRRFES
nr:sorting nexin-13 isoform X1 [Ciona intestinalis]|eukprot:XP_018666665.1 sorting nexin-13 isoform X1 [Ciona intestinalis]